MARMFTRQQSTIVDPASYACIDPSKSPCNRVEPRA
jgi:hypothetical protein